MTKISKKTRQQTIETCEECKGNPETYRKELGNIDCKICNKCLEVVSYKVKEKEKKSKKVSTKKQQELF